MFKSQSHAAAVIQSCVAHGTKLHDDAGSREVRPKNFEATPINLAVAYRLDGAASIERKAISPGCTFAGYSSSPRRERLPASLCPGERLGQR
jgi:hypothetical protein